eukprot:571432-Amphidinium_carterae.1
MKFSWASLDLGAVLGFAPMEEECHFHLAMAMPKSRVTWRTTPIPSAKQGFARNLGDGDYAVLDPELLDPTCP